MKINIATHLKRSVTRRDVLAASGGLTAALLLARHGSTQAQQQAAFPKTIRWSQIGEGKTEPATVIRYGIGDLDVARRLGGATIDWKPGFQASLPVIEAISANAVDFSFVTSTALIYAIGANVPLVPLVSYPLPHNEVDILVHADSPIQSAADLKGKKVADHRGTTGTYSLVRYLKTANLTLRDVDYVNLSAPDAEAAFANRRVDAWISWQPMIELARRRHKARALPNVKTYDYAFYVGSEKFVKSYPQAAAALTLLVRDAQRYIEAHPEQAVEKFARLGGFGSDILERQVYLEVLKAHRSSYSGAENLNLVDQPTKQNVQELADSFHALGIYPERVNVLDRLNDNRFDSIRAVVAAELKTHP
ncbi:MAG: ABC transporter substrate-binding protein [Burkholderiaceae bacterium]|nr:ABC transporter substrate-binding protein [Burkholderiaceae bacterium]